ncbi:tyrosine kinase receptor Cad96Ca-like isoform X3 [Amphiura filiformis]|uniref:tyrosine kinase receptor Cad96Ca-like isoform X3 n=1 Tax=Amphiura filiformis TaxID=82378 RepID=UPI003B219563
MTLVWYVYTSLVIPAMVVSQACPPDFCFNGGTCYIDNGIPSCDCLQGYRGPQCGDMVIGPPGGDPCDPSPCQNNGICLVVDDFHVICDCTSTSYGGMYCTENEMLSCQGINPCLNGGRCDVQTDGTYSCDCAGTGYTGETCTDLPDSGRESLAKLSNTTIIVIAVLGVAVGFLIVALCVIACCWYQRRQRRDREQRQQRRDELALRKQFQYEPSPVIRKKSGAFNRNNLTLCEQLGSGAFAVVYRATAKGIVTKGVETVVAVKMLHETSTEDDKMNFLKEVEMYKSLKPHPNIIGMLGTCIDKEPYYIIMEFASEGNLQSHLEKIRKHGNPTCSNLQSANNHNNSTHQFLTPNEIMTFAAQIARGMVYLADQQCVHRDLATRNILLGEGLVCKVSDFGLARDMAEENEYEMKSRGRVPLRWLALESLLLNVYSSKSDVWSYGVLLWELVTIGSQPYPGMTNGQVISELKKGYRLPKPEHCSEEIYDIMRKCWQENPDERPTFMQIQKEVEHMLEDAQGYLCMSEFNEHDYVYLSDY